VELLRLAAGGRCVLTVQALGEFFLAATRKRLLARPVAAAQVRRWMTVFPSPAAASVTAVVAAMDAAVEGRFSYWDALLLATAAEAGCAAASRGHGRRRRPGHDPRRAGLRRGRRRQPRRAGALL
jgi:predicted nucleic acid-binding protein